LSHGLRVGFVSYRRPRRVALAPLSLPDALPIYPDRPGAVRPGLPGLGAAVPHRHPGDVERLRAAGPARLRGRTVGTGRAADAARSEEHTSELQSRENLVCRLLLEKKKSDKDWRM